ncbi:hypothetical protein SAMN05661091_0644 [Paenibacillus uliginis N3/975]|uniref:ABC-type transport system involved in multi-copper enzyme maturation, permease component n=1 Tax=Paenibacillus uliginis N3/975 TaxID=1313296 RepID=A0A1X7GJY4_9BACL|nr:oligosaccharide repeat unit polymerase [Paenibacillus uliginis]SMF70228.1 hypothetical protein SAMN05661091_0644 [Paenibacillus uliginis N3/975]
MNKWLKQFALELRLVFGNPLFVLFPVIYAVIFLLFALGAGDYANPKVYNMLYQYYSFAHTISLGPAMLLGILTVRRDIRRPSYEWNRSFPVSFGMLLSAKYIVGIIYMSLFTMSASFIFYVISIGSGVDSSLVMRHTMNIVVQSEISYLVTFALAMLLGVCIANRVVYLIGFCAWMFGTFFMDIFLIEQLRLLPLKTFHLNQFFVTNNPLGDETWGYELFREELFSSWLFVLAFTLLLLVVSLLLLNRTRPTMNIKWCWLAAVGAAVLSVAAFVPYGSIWQERYASINEKLNDSTIRLSETEFSKDVRLNISKYDITLKRRPDNLLQFQAKLEVPTEEWSGKSSFPLTLHRNFQVSKVLVQGIDTPYQRKGERLNVEIPNEAADKLQIEVFYAGNIKDFLSDYNRERYPVFSVGSEVYLPRYMAWYPLPGHQDVYVKTEDPANRIHTGNRYSGMYFPPAEMKLTVEGYSVPLYTGMPEIEREVGYQRFEGKDVMGLTLLGSESWIELKEEGLPVTLVTTPYNRENAQIQLAELKEKYDYFTQWIPELKPVVTQIMYFGTSVESLQEESGKVDNGLILSSRTSFYDSGSGLPGEWMNAMLFGGQEGLVMYSGGDVEEDVRGRISSLFWYLYYREAKGVSDEELMDYYGWARSIQMLTMKDTDYDPKGIGRKMLRQVSKALNRGKEAEVKELLQHFYNQGISQPGRRDDFFLKEQPISYKEWKQEWNRVVHSHRQDK